MKTIHMIYEEEWGYTGISFEDKKSAQKYVDVINKTLYSSTYHVKERKLYEDLQDFIANNRDLYLSMLEKSCKMMVANDVFHTLNFKNGECMMSYSSIKNIVETNDIGMKAFTSGGTWCQVVESDLQVVIDKYNEINELLEEYKSMSKDLKKKANSSR